MSTVTAPGGVVAEDAAAGDAGAAALAVAEEAGAADADPDAEAEAEAEAGPAGGFVWAPATE
jgi:hypothetical protein